MKVAITGKGGVGKTTLSSTLARLYADEGRQVLAADVDPEFGAAHAVYHEVVTHRPRSFAGFLWS